MCMASAPRVVQQAAPPPDPNDFTTRLNTQLQSALMAPKPGAVADPNAKAPIERANPFLTKGQRGALDNANALQASYGAQSA